MPGSSWEYSSSGLLGNRCAAVGAFSCGCLLKVSLALRKTCLAFSDWIHASGNRCCGEEPKNSFCIERFQTLLVGLKPSAYH